MYAKSQHNILLCEAHYRKQKHYFRKNYSQRGVGVGCGKQQGCPEEKPLFGFRHNSGFGVLRRTWLPPPGPVGCCCLALLVLTHNPHSS